MTAFAKDSAIHVMAFDFGTQKIGVAVGQTISHTATPLPEIKARDGQPNWDEVGRLVAEWQPDAFVVGVPIQMNGEPFELTQRATKFGQRLHGRYGKPWFPMDERLSSFDARDHARQSGRHSGLVDSLAASLILESWFSDQWPQLQKDVPDENA